MASNLLTDVAISNKAACDKLQSLRDGGGLYVTVHPNGSKYFQLRTTLHGKEKRVQLGIYPDMSLKEAREAAMAARNLVADGVDPVQEKRKLKAAQAADVVSTFRAVADEWLKIKQRTLVPTSYHKITQSFNANVYPRFGSIPIKDIDARMVREAMQVMEKRGALELMEKCRAWIRDVFEFTLGEGMLMHNPIPAKDQVLQKHSGVSHPTFKNRQDAGKCLRNLQEYSGRIETRLAIWLKCLLQLGPVSCALLSGKSLTLLMSSGLSQWSA